MYIVTVIICYNWQQYYYFNQCLTVIDCQTLIVWLKNFWLFFFLSIDWSSIEHIAYWWPLEQKATPGISSFSLIFIGWRSRCCRNPGTLRIFNYGVSLFKFLQTFLQLQYRNGRHLNPCSFIYNNRDLNTVYSRWQFLFISLFPYRGKIYSFTTFTEVEALLKQLKLISTSLALSQRQQLPRAQGKTPPRKNAPRLLVWHNTRRWAMSQACPAWLLTTLERVPSFTIAVLYR